MNKNSVAKTLDKWARVCIGLNISTLRYRHDPQIKKWCTGITLRFARRSVAYRALWGIHEGNCKPLTDWTVMHG